MSTTAIKIAAGTPVNFGSQGVYLGFFCMLTADGVVGEIACYIDSATGTVPAATPAQIATRSGTVLGSVLISPSDFPAGVRIEGDLAFKSCAPFTVPAGTEIACTSNPQGGFHYSSDGSGFVIAPGITLTGGGATGGSSGGPYRNETPSNPTPWGSASFSFSPAVATGFAVSPAGGVTGTSAAITGTGNGHTNWTSATTFAVSPTAAGASLTGVVVNVAAQTWTGTISYGTAVGNLAITDSADSATAVIAVAAPAPLALGPLTLGVVDSTGVVVNWPVATGGTGPYAYKLYSSPTAPFAPPGSGTLLYTGAALTYKDAAAAIGQPTFYRAVATDAALAAATSAQSAVAGSLVAEKPDATRLVFGFLGDSITHGVGASTAANAWVQVFTRAVQADYPERSIGFINQGIDGTTSADWVNATGGANLPAAIAAFQAAGVTHVPCMLGTNDAKTAVATPPSVYLANMTSIANSLTAAGFVVSLAASPYLIPGSYNQWDEASLGRLLAYRTQLATLNLPSVHLDSMQLFEVFMQASGAYLGDGVHPTDAGHAALGLARAGRFLGALAAGSGVYPAANSVLTTAGGFGPNGTTTPLYVPPTVGQVKAGETFGVGQVGTYLGGGGAGGGGSTGTPQTGDAFALLTSMIASGAFTPAALVNVPKAGYSLAPSGLDAIQVEAGVNARQALSPILAACGGIVAGAGTGVVVIKGGNSPVTRITATTDATGNRPTVALTLPA